MGEGRIEVDFPRKRRDKEQFWLDWDNVYFAIDSEGCGSVFGHAVYAHILLGYGSWYNDYTCGETVRVGWFDSLGDEFEECLWKLNKGNMEWKKVKWEEEYIEVYGEKAFSKLIAKNK